MLRHHSLTLRLEFSDARSFEGGSGGWYRIQTWLGEKWLLKQALLEDIKEKPVSYNLKLTGQEHVYSYPFAVKPSEEKIEPQVVKVVAEWDNRTGPTQGDQWLKIELPQDNVWVNPKRALLERPVGIVKTDEKIALTKDTETFRYPLTSEPIMRHKPFKFMKNGPWRRETYGIISMAPASTNG